MTTVELESARERDEALRWAKAFRIPHTLESVEREDWVNGDTYIVWRITVGTEVSA